jgi:hypothetical protein
MIVNSTIALPNFPLVSSCKIIGDFNPDFYLQNFISELTRPKGSGILCQVSCTIQHK